MLITHRDYTFLESEIKVSASLVGQEQSLGVAKFCGDVEYWS